jgi:uncharacterized membrane protein
MALHPQGSGQARHRKSRVACPSEPLSGQQKNPELLKALSWMQIVLAQLDRLILGWKCKAAALPVILSIALMDCSMMVRAHEHQIGKVVLAASA